MLPQCLLHQSILITQGPIHEIFTKIFWELAILKTSVFLSRPIWNFCFKKKIVLLHPHENQSKLLGYQGWVEILVITLVYSKRVSVRNILLHSVCGKDEGVTKFLTDPCALNDKSLRNSIFWLKTHFSETTFVIKTRGA